MAYKQMNDNYLVTKNPTVLNSCCATLRRLSILARHWSLLLFLQISLLGTSLVAYDTPTQDYTVSQGDTLYSLARRYSVSVNEIMTTNGLESNTELKPGMLLKIPAKNFQGQGSRSASSIRSGYSTHTVVRGDTYYSIARKYSMPLSELLKLNGLESRAILKLGQTLVVKELTKGAGGSAHASAEALSSDDFSDVVRGNYYWPASGRREMLNDKFEGVRILTQDQSLVYAVRDGTVMWQGPYRSYGVVVLIASNDGYVYLYGGNVHFLVNIGQEVRKGEPLGKVDSQVGNQLAGQSPIYQGYNEQLASANRYPSQVYFSVFRNGEFISLKDAPRS